MTPPPRPQLPGSGPEPVEIAAILGIAVGWTLAGFGTLIGWVALVLCRRWTVSQRIVAIAGPVAAGLAPLVIMQPTARHPGGALVALGCWIAGSLAAGIYLWWVLPGRDGSVS